MKITDETIESLQKQLELLEPDRQHGKAGKVLEDTEAEKRRLYNNLASRISRAKKKLKQQNLDLKIAGIKEVDEFGITDIDIRRYKKCFIYENVLPERDYIKRMTGLTDIQVAELDRRVRDNLLTI